MSDQTTWQREALAEESDNRWPLELEQDEEDEDQ